MVLANPSSMSAQVHAARASDNTQKAKQVWNKQMRRGTECRAVLDYAKCEICFARDAKSIIHAAHAAAGHRWHCRFFLRQFRNHGFGSDQQAGD